MVATETRTNNNHRMAKKEKAKVHGKNAVHALIEDNENLRTTLQQIEKQFGEGSIMPLGGDRMLTISGIPTGSLSLDVAVASSKFLAQNPAAKPPSPCTSRLRPKRPTASPLSSTPSMPSIPLGARS